MSIERFTELAQAWGAERARWPEHERALHERFADTPEGMAILADAQRIDLFLDTWQLPDEGDERIARIVAATRLGAHAAAPPPALRPVATRRHYGAWLSSGFLASAVLGFVLGFTQPDTVDTGPAYTEMLLGSTSIMEEFQ